MMKHEEERKKAIAACIKKVKKYTPASFRKDIISKIPVNLSKRID